MAVRTTVRHRSLASPLALASALTIVLGGTAAASANPRPQPSPASARPGPGAQPHCVIHLEEHGKKTCHQTFREMIADATGGHITDAPQSAAAAESDRRFNARLNSTSHGKNRAPSTLQDNLVVLSIEYEHAGFGGRSNAFTGTHPCTVTTSDLDFSIADIHTTIGLGDTISSFQTFSGCFVNHFEHGNFGGIQTGYQPTQTAIGAAMNDLSSSLQWS